MSDGLPLKLCHKCGQMKPESKDFFCTGKKSHNGLRPLCKECRKERRRKTPAVPEGYKRCSRCKGEYPATLDHFGLHQRSRDHLDNYCIPCRREIYQEKRHKPRAAPPHQFTCTRCGVPKPATMEFFHKDPACLYGLRLVCKDCVHAAAALDRKLHPEKHAARVRRRYHAKRDHVRQVQNRWRTANRTRRREQERQRRLAHPESFHQNKLRYRRSDHGKLKSRIYCRARRARKKGAGGSYTPAQILTLYRQQHSRCYYCARPMPKYHIEHVIPLSRGGSNDISNIVLSCPGCNQSKHNKLPHEWPQGGRLL